MESDESKTSIVGEVFQGNNYKRWSACMRNYLRGEGLWEVLNEETRPEENGEKFKIWEKKDAKVLHLIQISCSPNMLDQIVELDSAKAAWDHLASMKGEQEEEMEEKEETKIECLDIQPDLLLYDAINSGDWEAAMNLLESKGDDKFSTVISPYGETILHVATHSGQFKLVKKLVKVMKRDDMEIKTIYGQTALSCAVRLGNTKIARHMVMQNPNLVTIPNRFGEIPVSEAAYYGHKAMVKYLKSVTPYQCLDPATSTQGVDLLTFCIEVEFYDLALDLLQIFPRLAVHKNRHSKTALRKLVEQLSAFKSGSELVFWQRWIDYSLPVRIPGTSNNTRRDIESGYEGPLNRESMTQIALNRSLECLWDVLKLFVPFIKSTYKEKLKHMQVQKLLSCICEEMSSLSHAQLVDVGFFDATADSVVDGIVEFFIEAEKLYPDILSIIDNKSRNIFFIATRRRHNNILNLMFNSTRNTQTALNSRDNGGNNILHCAAKLAPSAKLELISGAALQMQWELKWFKEVENLVRPSMRGATNNGGKTPWTLFTEQHKKLKEEGEKWMKDNATSCSLVSALIATIMFAAAFTVPGGNDGSKGIPIFLHRIEFKVFIVSDALSLFSAATSVLMFLGILTSRYREEDFLVSLPTKLIIGLSTLFFSIATMVISFGTTLVLMFQNRSAWFLTPIILIASIPVLAFAWMQFPLLLEIFYSTYILTILQKPKKLHIKLQLLRNAACNFLTRGKVKLKKVKL